MTIQEMQETERLDLINRYFCGDWTDDLEAEEAAAIERLEDDDLPEIPEGWGGALMQYEDWVDKNGEEVSPGDLVVAELRKGADRSAEVIRAIEAVLVDFGGPAVRAGCCMWRLNPWEMELKEKGNSR